MSASARRALIVTSCQNLWSSILYSDTGERACIPIINSSALCPLHVLVTTSLCALGNNPKLAGVYLWYRFKIYSWIYSNLLVSDPWVKCHRNCGHDQSLCGIQTEGHWPHTPKTSDQDCQPIPSLTPAKWIASRSHSLKEVLLCNEHQAMSGHPRQYPVLLQHHPMTQQARSA